VKHVPEGSYSRVELSMPSEAGVGEAVKFSLKGELVRLPYGVPYMPNFATALWYEDGPQDSVKAVIEGHEYSISKKTGLAFPVKPAYAGTTISVSGTVKLEATGTYVFKGLTGYIDEASGALYVDAEDEKRVATKQPSTPAPTPTPTPTPAPEIPWWPIAIAGALVAAVAVAGVIIAVERERQMMLMMAPMR
jgi:hypothetical protein